MAGFLKKYKSFLTYGISLALLMILLRFLEWKMIVMDHSVEIYVGLIALMFTGLGIWLAGQLGLPEIFTINVEGESFPIVWGIVGSAILSLILGLFTRRTVV